MTAIRTYVLAAALLTFGSAADSQARPVVVELYTAEGCSSCPPAESYVGELAQRSDVLALAFHVDYWDDLGWRDRFSLAAATRRQKVYAETLRRPSVYTPQIVVDGSADYVGSDRRAVENAISGSRTGVPLEISVRGADVTVDIGSQAQAPESDVILVAYLRSAVSAIGRGENAGRTLQEFNIVRAVRKIGRWDGRAQVFRSQASSLPPDATDVAVLVQPDRQGRIIGAGSVPLR